MGDERASVQPLGEWLQVSRSIEIALEGLTEADLNFRGGSNGWSIRENVHHVVESNLVACTIVIAAVGKGGITYDCSWMNPDRAWSGDRPRPPDVSTLLRAGARCRLP